MSSTTHNAEHGRPDGIDTNDGGHHDDGGPVHAHVSNFWFMCGIFGALIVLTFITVGVSYFDFGQFNLVIAVLVATMKASLVATFFMHLKYDKAFNATIFVAAFVFLGLLLYFSGLDIGTRGEIDRDNGTHVFERNGMRAPGGFSGSEDMVGLPHAAHGEGASHEAAGAAHAEPAMGGSSAAPAAH